MATSKRFALVFSLLILGAAGALVAAQAAPAPSVAATAVAPQTSAPAPDATAGPAPKAAPPSQAKGSELPVKLPKELGMPKPTPTCLTGWCSSDSQCQLWLKNPNAVCLKQPGASCGQCSVEY